MPPCPAENKSLENRALSASGGRHVTENIILIRGGRIGNCYGKAEALKEFEGHCAGVLTIQMTFGFVCFGVQRAFVAQSLFQEVGKALKETFGFGIFKHFCFLADWGSDPGTCTCFTTERYMSSCISAPWLWFLLKKINSIISILGLLCFRFACYAYSDPECC